MYLNTSLRNNSWYSGKILTLEYTRPQITNWSFKSWKNDVINNSSEENKTARSMILLLKKHQILVIRPLNPTLSKNVQTNPESRPLCFTFSNFVKLFDGGVQYCLSKGNLEQKIIYLNKKNYNKLCILSILYEKNTDYFLKSSNWIQIICHTFTFVKSYHLQSW